MIIRFVWKSVAVRSVSYFLFLPLQSHTYDRFETTRTTGGTTGGAIIYDCLRSIARSVVAGHDWSHDRIRLVKDGRAISRPTIFSHARSAIASVVSVPSSIESSSQSLIYILTLLFMHPPTIRRQRQYIFGALFVRLSVVR